MRDYQQIVRIIMFEGDAARNVACKVQVRNGRDRTLGFNHLLAFVYSGNVRGIHSSPKMYVRPIVALSSSTKCLEGLCSPWLST